MKKLFMLCAFALLAVSAGSCQKKDYKNLGDGLFADIQTNKGNIIVKLYFEETPVTVANFVSLANGTNPKVADSLKGKPFYDNTIFHRVIKDFMIQGGDILGTGAGKPGYQFEDEIVDTLKFDGKGILAMANAGPGTNGSQFFITHKETPWLTGRHTIFGKVVKGIEVVDTIAAVKVEQRSNKPLQPITVKHVEIIQNGKAAKKFDAAEVFEKYFVDKELKEKEAAEKLAAHKAKFLEETAKQKQEAITSDSGIQIYYLNKSEGEKPELGSKVLVNYAGYLAEDGTLFDSNIKEVAEQFGKYDARRDQMNGYTPSPMDYKNSSNLIAGFKEALLQMKVGDKVRVFIPFYLGYGERGAGGVIPGNADLVFDLEIVGIKSSPTGN
ncbi:peptidylprolyl isomerase [Neptunitalea lumnitzerae]|uniref:peptidylprolyl isomerase n=1 Tax=Neptunitalea lumnitzerae TaxID=2965509 RepID=A0ABQ5MLQ9_9FLAO|nr:peptidylprolyl isomerase [Neptunitalea sp. Y10]GLB49887.1 peptidylprolyl isomerase [Neptunitalea sp. Y10]